MPMVQLSTTNEDIVEVNSTISPNTSLKTTLRRKRHKEQVQNISIPTPPKSLLFQSSDRPKILTNGSLKNHLHEHSSWEWKKVLYLKQNVPDNYVPESFLQDLRKNVNLEKYQLMDIIKATSALTQQLTSIVILISMFIFFDHYGHQEAIVSLLVISILVTTSILYLTTIFILPKNNSKYHHGDNSKLKTNSIPNSVFAEIKSSIIFLVTGFAMSPILRTLTETISTDTIYAMVTIMMLIHLSFNNYGINAAIVSQPISLNAAFFASVCLASRLQTAFQSFAFLTFAIDIFVLSSFVYSKLPLKSSAKMTMTFIFTGMAIVMLFYTFVTVFCYLFIFLIIFINFICPFGFYKMQEYKENIYGPWDEAIIDRSNFTFKRTLSMSSPTSPSSSSKTFLNHVKTSNHLKNKSINNNILNQQSSFNHFHKYNQ
ncbi:hypothetical protein BLOT_015387 [Blomia tropicalis]|nr:hypothetical protein BLOT_015387 [Blomia tropicalis]